jgi:hypothetical protein
MFENDYLMRMILQLTAAIRRSLAGERRSTGEEVDAIEDAVSDAVDIQRELLFSLEPNSMLSLLQLGAFDSELGEYIVRSLYYEAELLEELGLASRAGLRRAQADAIAAAYDISISREDVTEAALTAFLDAAEAEDPQAAQAQQQSPPDQPVLAERHDFPPA